jgi:hypothetical protein
MGRHTKDVRDGGPADDGPRRVRRVGKMPLLPAVAGVVVVGVVVSALSTKQIALNFAGPPVATTEQPPQVKDSTHAHGRHTARDDSSSGPRRASRGSGRGTVSVAFRTVSSWTSGFQAQVTLTNRGRTAVKGWTLTLRYPGASIVSVRGARVVREGTTLVARNPAAHPSIAPGRAVRLLFTADGTAARRPACAFNGGGCRS